MLGKLTSTENKKRLLANFASLVVLRGAQFLIPLISLPYLVRTIGLENFGLINFSLSLGLYFGAIIQFGFGITATREIARHRDDPIKLTKIYSVTLTASLILATVSAALFAFIVLFFEKFNGYLDLYFFTLAFIIFQSLFPIWFFQGIEKMKYITLLSLASNALFLISLFIFVKQPSDFVFVPLLHAIAAFLTFSLAIGLIYKKFKVKFIPPHWQEIKASYRDGCHAFISQLAPSLYNNSAVFLLGLFANNTLVGFYSAATKVIDAAISFAYVLSNTFLPYFSRDLGQHRFFQKIMLGSGLLLTLAAIIFSDWIVGVLFGLDNMQAANYIKWLAVCILLVFVSVTYGTNYLMLIGRDKVVKNIVLFTSIIFFAAAVVIIPLWGIWGAIVTLVGARFVISALQYAFYVKYRNSGYNA